MTGGTALAALSFGEMIGIDAVQMAGKVGLALALFVLGYIAARFVSGLVLRSLRKTAVDDKLASSIGWKPQGGAMERLISGVVFWLLMAVVLVAVLDAAGLSQVAEPIQDLVGAVLLAVPPLAKAGAILLVAWAVGKLIGKAVESVLSHEDLGLDGRLARWSGEELPEDTPDSAKLGAAIGRFVYWLVLFFGLTAAMDAMGISALVDPIKELLASILSMLPALVVAAVILAVGWYGGRLIGTIVSNLLSSAGMDNVIDRAGLQRVFEKRPASEVVGIIVMAFVVLQAVVAALGKLGIAALSDPLTAMMSRFWAVLPAVFTAAVIMAVGIVVARIARDVVSSVLESIGFDSLFERLGLADLAEKSDQLKKPSILGGRVAALAVILMATVQALETVGLTAWADWVSALLAYAVQRVLPAIIIVGVAFALGNFVRDLVASTARGNDERRWLASLSRWAILVFAFTMALHQLDVAQSFVTMAFGILFGALCLAGALAFGLGGKDVAAEIVRQRYEGMSDPPGAEPLKTAAAEKRLD